VEKPQRLHSTANKRIGHDEVEILAGKNTFFTKKAHFITVFLSDFSSKNLSGILFL
jgi:hypothetical protein